MKILVAEDSLTQATLMKHALQRIGYEVILARDGIEAIKKAWQEYPDVVVSDVVMPRLNGYQVCRLLRDHQSTARIPVILLTSLDQRQDVFWGLKSGADKFITKGGDIAALVAQIHEFLEKSGSPGSAAAAAHDGGSRGVDVDADVMERVIQLLDKNLFDSTVAAEIQDLVNTLDDLRATVLGVLEILGKVLDFHVGAIHLGGDEQQGLFVLVNKTVDDSFISVLCEQLRRETPGSEAGPGGATEIVDPQHLLSRQGDRPRLPGAVLIENLTTKGRPSGSIAIATAESTAYPERDEETFKMIVRHANIVVDYARLYESTKMLSITDGLTKLYNHRYFQDALKREFVRCQRHKSPLSLVLLDIDHFKRFNDTYGHQQGDIVLQELARTLRMQVRNLDIVARYGGEEFAVIMPEASLEVALLVAERLRAAVENHPVEGPSGPLRVTVSLGVAAVPRAETGVPAGLIAAADRALYRAKELGRNRVASQEQE
ncbi:MAG: diguanylate cyclase [Candidatus Methylomirabilia bacterium]